MANADDINVELARVRKEMEIEGDPSKRTLLKLQLISLEYELLHMKKEEKDGH